MDITWYGHSCFRISERGRLTVVTDPYSDELGLPPLRIKGDIVTISHHSSGHNFADGVKGGSYTLDAPGEYEIGEIFLRGIAMHYIGEDVVRPNVAFRIDYSGLTVLHLGDLAHIPTQSELSAFGAVNVLIVPVGGGNGLRAGQAAEVVSLVEPNYIIPMHYALPGMQLELEPVDKFLKAMGVSKVQEDDVLKLTSSGLPEQPLVMILRPQLKEVER